MNADQPAWVYTHYAADGSALYVGCTRDLTSRWQTHRTTAEWFSDITEVGYLGPFPREAALILESRLINLYQPPNNLHGTHRERAARLYTAEVRTFVRTRSEQMCAAATYVWRMSGSHGPQPTPASFAWWVRNYMTDAERAECRQRADRRADAERLAVAA